MQVKKRLKSRLNRLQQIRFFRFNVADCLRTTQDVDAFVIDAHEAPATAQYLAHALSIAAQAKRRLARRETLRVC